jgi:hypothetical protein
MSGLVESVVAAWKAGYKLFHPTIARVVFVKRYTPQIPGPDTQRGILQGTTGPTGAGQSNHDKIEWLAPGRPAVGARFILLRLDNLDGRNVGFGFTNYDEIKTVVGQTVEIEINDQRAVMRSGAMEMSLEFAAQTTTLKNGVNQIAGSPAGWTVDGPITFNGEATFQKKITGAGEIAAAKAISSSEDVRAGTISLKLHPHSYQDSPVGPSVTGPAQ